MCSCRRTATSRRHHAGDCRTIVHYAGMDSVTVLAGDDVKRVILGSVFDDTSCSRRTPPRACCKVTFVGLNFFNGVGYDAASASSTRRSR